MKVIHLSNIAGRLGGGVSEVVHAFLFHQPKIGCYSSLWFIGRKEQEIEISNNQRISEDRLHSVSFKSFFNPLSYYKFKKISIKYQIIHQHGIFLPSSLFSIFMNNKLKIIINPHGYLEPEKMKVSSIKKSIVLSLFENHNLKNCHCLVACSKQEAKALRDFGLSQPIVVLPNGVDKEMLKNKSDILSESSFKNDHGIEQDKKVLLFLSRIHPFKGLELLLRSIHRIKDKFIENNWVFVLAGIDELNHESYLRKLSKDLNISEIIKFTGPQYNENKISAFDSADCFILPSKGENFGIAVIEALARGIPVIATQNTPWSELEDSRCGWCVERTEQGFISAILKLFKTNSNLLEEMGDRGIDLVSRKYTWSNIAKQSINMYKWVSSDFDNSYKKGFDLFD